MVHVFLVRFGVYMYYVFYVYTGQAAWNKTDDDAATRQDPKGGPTQLGNKKLSYCWETVRRESMPRIAEIDVEMTT